MFCFNFNIIERERERNICIICYWGDNLRLRVYAQKSQKSPTLRLRLRRECSRCEFVLLVLQTEGCSIQQFSLVGCSIQYSIFSSFLLTGMNVYIDCREVKYLTVYCSRQRSFHLLFLLATVEHIF